MAHDRASPPGLTSGPRLAKNVAWNFLGHGLPLLVGLATIPLLIDGLGVERFGILVLAWMIIGYFSLLGLPRALTKLVAENLGHRAGRLHSSISMDSLGPDGCIGDRWCSAHGGPSAWQ